MAAARPRRRRRPARRRLARWLKRHAAHLRWAAFGAAALLVVVLSLSSPPEGRRGREPVPAPEPHARRAAPSAIRAPETDRPAASRDSQPAAPAVPAAPPAAVGPRAALLIDDLGQTLEPMRRLEALRLPLTVAILPDLGASGRTAREAARLGYEILLHLPMEPLDVEAKHPGPGALLTTMSAGELHDRVAQALASVPGASGVNNHMGSRFTADRPALDLLMAELAGRGLFWVDSRTTPATRGAEAALAHGMPAAERDVFIDAEVRPEFIRAQLRRLVALARRRGSAIGIGHPHPETLAVLDEMREELLAAGVAWVPVSALLRRRGDPGEGTHAVADSRH